MEEETRNILVVDDDEAILELVESTLTHYGFQVEKAGKVNEAIAALKEGTPIDVVLLDLALPGVSGHAVLNYVNENRIKVPVIVISGKGTLDDAIQAFRSNAFDYLKKPFDLNDLVSTVRRAVRHRRHLLQEAGEEPAPETG